MLQERRDTRISTVCIKHCARCLIEPLTGFPAARMRRCIEAGLSVGIDLRRIAKPIPKPVSTSLDASSPESAFLRRAANPSSYGLPDSLPENIRLTSQVRVS